jgi:membrane-anchored mycosin MYCP
MRVRAAMAAVVATLGGSLAVVAPPQKVYAAPACPAVAPAAVEADAPWPQRRYGLERLAGLADGTGVLVAVVDSGVDSGHPQLAGAVAPGIDLLDPGGDGRLDCVGHGTAVASIIAARSRDRSAFRGVAPAAVILPVRVSERVDDSTSGRTAPVAAVAGAIRQAVDRGARIVNLSLTIDRDDPALRDAVRYAVAKDAVLVAAAGNRHDTGNPRPYPAAYDGVIGVGAIQADGTRVPQSQSGDYVDLVAPGAEVTAAARGGGHARYTGTSFAAAYVAGAAALVRQYHPALTAAQVAERLTATADTTGVSGGGYGAGVVNPYRAVTGRTDERAASHPGPLAAHTRNPAELAAAAAATRTRHRALVLGAAGTGLAVLILLAAAVLPRGIRRRWRPD